MLKQSFFYFLIFWQLCISCASIQPINEYQTQNNNLVFCNWIEGDWQLHIAQRDNEIKLCNANPCDGESFPTPIYFECKNQKIEGKLLEIVSKGEPIYSPVEVSLESEKLLIKNNNDNCNVLYTLIKKEDIFFGKYKSECRQKNMFPRKEGNVILVRSEK